MNAAGWQPRTWLGAPAPGGLALPAAQPTASWLYAPRGVFLGAYRGRDVLVAADTGNHRVMIWHSVPDRDEQPCDVVLGQPDFTSEGPAAGSGDARTGLHLPTGVLVHDDKLVVADAWHHRVLVYDGLPEKTGAEPDLILGQPDADHVGPNRGEDCTAEGYYWPFGIGVVGGRFYVADTGNRRVLGWSAGLPSAADVAPDLILGQPDARSRGENRDGPVCASSFRWPHAICGWPPAGTGDDGAAARTLLVADAGNHRVLGWTPAPDKDTDADLVLGQPGFDTATEMPYIPQKADTLRFPYSADADDSGDGTVTLAVADTANNRILLWEDAPFGNAGDHRPVTRDPDAGKMAHVAGPGTGPGATAVLGQPDFGPNGENRWSGVTRDSFCWPYGLSLHGNRLAVADSGNNRIVIWSRS